MVKTQSFLRPCGIQLPRCRQALYRSMIPEDSSQKQYEFKLLSQAAPGAVSGVTFKANTVQLQKP